MPVGRLTLMNTPSGPSSESASWIVKPADPGHREAALQAGEEDALRDRRRRVGVGDELPFASSLRMPPISAASSVAAEQVALDLRRRARRCRRSGTRLRAACRCRSGCPGSSRRTRGRAMPLMPVTLAESVRTKFVGSVVDVAATGCRSSRCWIGSQLGHWKLSPVAAPTRERTPKLSPAEKLPSPRKPKFVALPAIVEAADGQRCARRTRS